MSKPVPRFYWNMTQPDEKHIASLGETLPIHRIFLEMLVQRGIFTFEQAKDFFRPHLGQLHDPFLMKDMNLATSRLIQAFNVNEKILLYGDYDVDGTTCVATMYEFLYTKHKNIDFYIPDRYKEGYGISLAGIEFAKEHGFSLIIAMDCGIRAFKQIELAKEYGIDVIVCDHHLPEETLPPAFAILNPKQTDCPYPYKELSGCGIVFKFIQAIAMLEKIPIEEQLPLLDLVACSTACDIVEMLGENRTLMFLGLKQLNESPRLGLRILMTKNNVSQPLTVQDVVFGLGPLLNVAGRLGDAKLASKLLLCNDKFIAEDYADYLIHQNKERKALDKAMVTDAKELWEMTPNWQDQKSIVLFHPEWHKGVLGISAARVAEHFYRPTIILTQVADKAVGSVRSIAGVDVHEALIACSDVLHAFGGHAHAAGVTVSLDKLDIFKQQFEAAIAQQITQEESLQASLSITATLCFSDITPQFIRILKQFAPDGPSNRRPIFLTKNVQAHEVKLLKNEHLKLSWYDEAGVLMPSIAFGQGHWYEFLMQNQSKCDICYVLEENTWQGKKSLQLEVRDIRVAE